MTISLDTIRERLRRMPAWFRATLVIAVAGYILGTAGHFLSRDAGYLGMGMFIGAGLIVWMTEGRAIIAILRQGGQDFASWRRNR